MDPRLKALIEIRDLLKAEGWAPDDTDEVLQASTPDRKAALRLNPILALICVAAIATNFILIGANHDLRASRSAILSLVSMDCSVGPNKVVEGLEATLSVDGEDIWKGPIDERKSIDLRSVQPRKFDTKCVVEMWLGRSGERWREFAGLYTLSFDHETKYTDTLKFGSQFGARSGQISIELQFRIGR